MPHALNLIHLLETPVAHALAWALVHFLWQGALLGALLWTVLQIFGRDAHELRYRAAATALCAAVLVPLVTFGSLWIRLSESALRVDVLSSTYEIGTHPWLPSVVAHEGPLGTPFAALHAIVPYVVLAWATGAAILFVRLVGGWIYLRRLVARSLEASDVWQKRLE